MGEWECMWKRKFAFTMPFLCAEWTVEKNVNVCDNDVCDNATSVITTSSVTM